MGRNIYSRGRKYQKHFLSNLDVSISMGISLEVINVEGTDYLAGKLNLICEEDENLLVGVM